jgi:hypothetical protein
MAEGTGERPAVHCDGEEYAVRSTGELDQILDRLTADTPADMPRLAELINDAGDSLGLVIGADVSLLSFVGNAGNPPYYISVGELRAEGLFVLYVYGGHYSELPRRYCVSVEEAREAMRVFLEIGCLTDHLQWEES